MSRKSRLETSFEQIFNSSAGDFAADGAKQRLRGRAIDGLAREAHEGDEAEFAALSETAKIKLALGHLRVYIRDAANNQARRTAVSAAVSSALASFEVDADEGE